MGITKLTSYLSAWKQQLEVLFLNDVLRVYGFPEAGPACPRLILCRRREEWFSRDNVHVYAFLVIVPEVILEGALRGVILGDAILDVGKRLSQNTVFGFAVGGRGRRVCGLRLRDVGNIEFISPCSFQEGVTARSRAIQFVA